MCRSDISVHGLAASFLVSALPATGQEAKENRRGARGAREHQKPVTGRSAIWCRSGSGGPRPGERPCSPVDSFLPPFFLFPSAKRKGSPLPDRTRQAHKRAADHLLLRGMAPVFGNRANQNQCSPFEDATMCSNQNGEGNLNRFRLPATRVLISTATAMH